jgi:hypothetical protein
MGTDGSGPGSRRRTGPDFIVIPTSEKLIFLKNLLCLTDEFHGSGLFALNWEISVCVRGKNLKPIAVITAFESSLHQTPVSAVGKRDFARQRQRAPKGPWKSNRQIAETNRCTNARGFGAIRAELGNLCLRKTAWWGWEDSNFQPNDYQPPALSIEYSGAVS